jgi:hypothetical protein
MTKIPIESPEAIESPEWHKEILDERRQRVVDGMARLVDGETAKANSGEKIPGKRGS